MIRVRAQVTAKGVCVWLWGFIFVYVFERVCESVCVLFQRDVLIRCRNKSVCLLVGRLC